jgi:hypothetical protein
MKQTPRRMRRQESRFWLRSLHHCHGAPMEINGQNKTPLKVEPEKAATTRIFSM